MVNCKVLLLLFMAILCSFTVHAALFKGTVYDDALEPEEKIVLSIGTEQQLSHDGSFEFSLEPGMYTLNISKVGPNGSFILLQQEYVTITQDKTHVYDVILLDLQEEEYLVEDAAALFSVDSLWRSLLPLYIVSFILIAMVAGGILLYKRRLIKQNRDVESQVLDMVLTSTVMNFIKNKGGRVTQKDIRQHFPASEAKISLLLSELEDKGLIKKLKKGRSNIILLKL